MKQSFLDTSIITLALAISPQTFCLMSSKHKGLSGTLNGPPIFHCSDLRLSHCLRSTFGLWKIFILFVLNPRFIHPMTFGWDAFPFLWDFFLFLTLSSSSLLKLSRFWLILLFFFSLPVFLQAIVLTDNLKAWRTLDQDVLDCFVLISVPFSRICPSSDILNKHSLNFNKTRF